MKERYRLSLAYDGSNYSGWQIQVNAPSIQQKLQEAISLLVSEQTFVVAAGRTDAGVHAKEQVVHFDSPKLLEEKSFLKSLNGILPLDIRVKTCQRVGKDFHARYNAKGKIYHYYFCTNRFSDPFRRLYSLHLKGPFNKQALLEAKQYFLGTHDFRSFANEAHAGSAAKNPVRTIKRIDLVDEGEGFFRLEFEAESFLYKMVRNMTGVLLEAAQGKREPQEVQEILLAKDRRKAGKAAAARGLFMWKVFY